MVTDGSRTCGKHSKTCRDADSLYCTYKMNVTLWDNYNQINKTKTYIIQTELWWMSDSFPKTQSMFSCFDVLQESRIQAEIQSVFPRKQASGHMMCCRINSSTSETPIKMLPCHGKWPQDVPKSLTWYTLERFYATYYFWVCNRIQKEREIPG